MQDVRRLRLRLRACSVDSFLFLCFLLLSLSHSLCLSESLFVGVCAVMSGASSVGQCVSCALVVHSDTGCSARSWMIRLGEVLHGGALSWLLAVA